MNLDLIDMVQRARMMHDEAARPSDYAAVYWIEAKRQPGDYPAATANAGEWRVRLTVETVDAVWEMVKRATVEGKLGYKSKVSTRPAAGQADPDERLLCVRTYDADDQVDMRAGAGSSQRNGIERSVLRVGQTGQRESLGSN